MDYSDPRDRTARLTEFREKIQSLSMEELVALTTIMKRRSDDLREELKVLAGQILARRERLSMLKMREAMAENQR